MSVFVSQGSSCSTRNSDSGNSNQKSRWVLSSITSCICFPFFCCCCCINLKLERTSHFTMCSSQKQQHTVSANSAIRNLVRLVMWCYSLLNYCVNKYILPHTVFFGLSINLFLALLLCLYRSERVQDCFLIFFKLL